MNDGSDLNCPHGWGLFLLQIDLVLNDANVAADGDLAQFWVVVVAPYEAECCGGDDYYDG